jgi:glycosyltransferase involved in cell wall biosynthesis
MACGKAIIASDKVGCTVDLVKDGYNGFVVKANDSLSLLKKMQLCLTSVETIIRMGERSSSIVKNWNFGEFKKVILKELRSNESDFA